MSDDFCSSLAIRILETLSFTKSKDITEILQVCKKPWMKQICIRFVAVLGQTLTDVVIVLGVNMEGRPFSMQYIPNFIFSAWPASIACWSLLVYHTAHKVAIL